MNNSYQTNKSLEGLRGIAATLVVLFHMGAWSFYIGAIGAGYLAVDLFFVISGFVVYSAYGDRLSTCRDAVRFIVRRIGRLWPLHIAANILYFSSGNIPAFIMGHAPIFPYHFAELLSLGLMAQSLNLFDHFVGLTVSWSASDEFYIYLLLSAICLIFFKYRVLVIAILCVGSYAALLFVQERYFQSCLSPYPFFCITNPYGWLRCGVGFFGGALIAVYRKNLLPFTHPKAQVFVGVTTILFFQILSHIPFLTYIAPIVFCALVASLSGDNGPISIALRTKSLQYLGSISYSLYLSHAVCLIFLLDMQDNSFIANRDERQIIGCVFFLCASIALAHIMHRYIEVPCRIKINSWVDARIEGDVYMPFQTHEGEREPAAETVMDKTNLKGNRQG